jgi:hypothetical protein
MSEKTEMSHVKRNIVIAIIFTVVITSAFFIVAENLRNSESPARALKPHTENIISETIDVAYGSYNYYSFNVPNLQTDSPVLVSGVFLVAGGNDIKVYVMNFTEFFDNQKAIDEAMCYYSSGQVSSGAINTTVHRYETYYLVFDNTYATTQDPTDQKQITVQASFTYFT